MIIVSLVINIAVLIPVTIALVRGAGGARGPFGERTPARDILLAIYLAILLISSALLTAVATVGPLPAVEAAAVSLFVVQIIYKALTAITVRRALRNPVVLANLGIAAVHAVTVATLAPSIVT